MKDLIAIMSKVDMMSVANTSLSFRLLSTVQKLLIFEDNKLYLDFGTLVIEHAVKTLNGFCADRHSKRVTSVQRVCLENLRLFSQQKLKCHREHMFNFIEHQVARCLCNHIGHLVALEKDEQDVNYNKADKTQRLDMLVELMDMLANVSLHEQIFHHMHTFLPIESFFTTLDDIFLLWICSNNSSSTGPCINIANRMKKKRMMETNVLQSGGNVAFCGKTKTPNEDHATTIVFDSLLNLVRNLLPCNVSRLKLMQSSVLLKALLKLEYIHDYNVVSIFHNPDVQSTKRMSVYLRTNEAS